MSRTDDNSGSGLRSLELSCLPTEKNLKEIQTLVIAVKHGTTGRVYDRYVNGVKQGQKTLHNADISFLLINLETKECLIIENALFGEDAEYDSKQKKFGNALARKYVKYLYAGKDWTY